MASICLHSANFTFDEYVPADKANLCSHVDALNYFSEMSVFEGSYNYKTSMVYLWFSNWMTY